MAPARLTLMLRHLRRSLGRKDADVSSDGQLLERFLTLRDEMAFAALVQRHAALVWSISRGLLPIEADAEDVFQATFLVLLRRADSLDRRAPLTPWLAAVARRTALKLRRDAGRRRSRDRRAALSVIRETTAAEELAQRESARIVHEEVQRLPDKYQLPVLLCWLQGRTHEEAARELGIPRGLMAKRLAGAQDRLRKRLLARGVTWAGAALAVLKDGTCPASLQAATIQTALQTAAGETVLQGASASVLSMAEGVVRAMTLVKVRAVVIVLLAVGVLGVGAAEVWRQAKATPPTPPVAVALQPLAPETARRPVAVGGASRREPRLTPEQRQTYELLDKLSNPVKFLGFEPDPKMTFADCLQYLSERHDVTFDVDEYAFNREYPKDQELLSFPCATRGMPAMTGVPLSVVVDTLCDRAEPRATYCVRGGTIRIIPLKHANLEELFDTGRDFVPRVSLEFSQHSVREALEEVKYQSGISVVFDSRVVAKAEKMMVTTTLSRVPVDTAVWMLADMADLGPVVLQGAIYVTSKANAAEMQRDQDNKRQRRQKQTKSDPKD